MDRRRSRAHPSVQLSTDDAGAYWLTFSDADDEEDPWPVQVRTGQRQTVGLTIRDAGLTIHLPPRATLTDAQAFLDAKAAWLRKHLIRQQQLPVAPDFADGSQVDWLGQSLTIALLPGSGRSVHVERDAQFLVVRVPVGKPKEVVPSAIADWYARQALAYFSPRLAHFAHRMGCKKVPPLGLSSARGKWGSCRSDGAIRLNWRLMQAPPELIDYVICHELAHLVEFNHSPRFWAQVAVLCPDYLACRKQLKLQGRQWLQW